MDECQAALDEFHKRGYGYAGVYVFVCLSVCLLSTLPNLWVDYEENFLENQERPILCHSQENAQDV